MQQIKNDQFIQNGEIIGNKETHRTIRGFPRDKAIIKEVEQMLGGKLLDDNKDSKLILLLDRHFMIARLKGENPDYIALPKDPLNYYLPIPFDIHIFGTTIKNYIKPAWARVPKKFNMGVPSWKL